MSSTNSIQVLGNLTRDPELLYTPGNTAITKGCIATNRAYKKKEEDAEEVLYLNYVMFGNQAEAFAKYMEKGRKVFMSGRLKTESWKSPDGEPRSRIVMIVNESVFLGDKKGGTAPKHAQSRPSDSEPPIKDEIPF